AAQIIDRKYFCAPGVIFPDMLSLYGLSKTMEHFYFMPPFLWPDLETKVFGTKKVAWLLAVPISDAEAQVAGNKGAAALEDLFDAEQIDIFDLQRPSVV